MNTGNADILMMERALELAARGYGFTSPNPMVGAVIAGPDGRVIGEGWHRRYGEGHAEVNAVASVSESDRPLLKESTMYVTLEPCSHYGKTPPCVRLIVECGIPRVVVATLDPNEKVAGRGIAILRDAGIDVETGLLGDRSRALNKVFMTAHTLRRPFITLKWACSSDGFMDCLRADGDGACRFSNQLSSLETMKLRAAHDAVLTTAATANADGARLTVRGWTGRQPLRVVVDRSGSLDAASPLLTDQAARTLVVNDGRPLELLMEGLFREHGVTSVLVEAGPRFLSALIEAGLWDEARVETAPFALGERGRCHAPVLADACVKGSYAVGDNRMTWYRRSDFPFVAPQRCEKI